jgi:hypothetical protein
MNPCPSLFLLLATSASSLGATCFSPLPLPAGTTAKQVAKASKFAVPALDPRTLITDDKIGRYILHQREINTVAAQVVDVATSVQKETGRDAKAFEKGMKADRRTPRINDVAASARAKSGLSDVEYAALAQILGKFVGMVMVNDEGTQKRARAEFRAEYGDEALAVVEKQAPELVKVYEEMVSAITGRR